MANNIASITSISTLDVQAAVDWGFAATFFFGFFCLMILHRLCMHIRRDCFRPAVVWGDWPALEGPNIRRACHAMLCHAEICHKRGVI